MSIRFYLNGVQPACPDPETVDWEFMEELEQSISGRGIQQGNMRCILGWELMADEHFAALMNVWVGSFANGFRINNAVVPPFLGADNATWITVAGPAGDDILIRKPEGRRTVLQVDNVRLILEDIQIPAG